MDWFEVCSISVLSSWAWQAEPHNELQRCRLTTLLIATMLRKTHFEQHYVAESDSCFPQCNGALKFLPAPDLCQHYMVEGDHPLFPQCNYYLRCICTSTTVPKATTPHLHQHHQHYSVKSNIPCLSNAITISNLYLHRISPTLPKQSESKLYFVIAIPSIPCQR